MSASRCCPARTKLQVDLTWGSVQYHAKSLENLQEVGGMGRKAAQRSCGRSRCRGSTQITPASCSGPEDASVRSVLTIGSMRHGLRGGLDADGVWAHGGRGIVCREPAHDLQRLPKLNTLHMYPAHRTGHAALPQDVCGG